MIVLDCSAGIEIARNTLLGKSFQRLILQGEEIIVPALYPEETANVAWKYVHSKVLNKAEAKQLMEDALALPDRIIATEELVSESFALAVSCEHSVYDCLYLVLTRRCDACLLTADKKLQYLSEQLGIDCVSEVTLDLHETHL